MAHFKKVRTLIKINQLKLRSLAQFSYFCALLLLFDPHKYILTILKSYQIKLRILNFN